MTKRSRLPDQCISSATVKALVLALSALALALTTSPSAAQAVEYHTTCVGHGWVAGASPSDGSAFSRIETGCGTTTRSCDLYNWGTFKGGQATSTTTCNAWLPDYCACTECASYAKLTFSAAFSQHNHTPDGYCAGFRALADQRIQSVDPLGDEPIEDSPDVTPDGTAIPGATAPDPDGGADFAVRVYRSQTGWTCPEAGRVKNGVFGQQYEDGWRDLGLDSAGACADLDRQPVGFAVNTYPQAGDIPAHAVVFGSVANGVSSVTVTIAGVRHELSIVSGTFVLPTTTDALKAGALLTVDTEQGPVSYEVPIGAEA